MYNCVLFCQLTGEDVSMDIYKMLLHTLHCTEQLFGLDKWGATWCSIGVFSKCFKTHCSVFVPDLNIWLFQLFNTLTRIAALLLLLLKKRSVYFDVFYSHVFFLLWATCCSLAVWWAISGICAIIKAVNYKIQIWIFPL